MPKMPYNEKSVGKVRNRKLKTKSVLKKSALKKVGIKNGRHFEKSVKSLVGQKKVGSKKLGKK